MTAKQLRYWQIVWLVGVRKAIRASAELDAIGGTTVAK
jgi:hypothetical protein